MCANLRSMENKVQQPSRLLMRWLEWERDQMENEFPLTFVRHLLTGALIMRVLIISGIF